MGKQNLNIKLSLFCATLLILVFNYHGFGQHPRLIKTVAESPLRIVFLDETNGWITDHNGRVLLTKDGGSTWARDIYIPSSRLSGLFFANGELWLTGSIVGKNGQSRCRVWKKAQTSGELKEISIGGDNGCFLHDIVFMDRDIGYAVGEINSRNETSAVIFVTADGGNNWKESLRVENKSLFYRIKVIDGRAIAIGDSLIAESENAGENWKVQNYETPLFALDSINGHTYIVGAYTTVITNKSDFQKWDKFEMAPEFASDWFGTVTFGGKEGWIGGGVGGKAKLLHSTNFGMTWNVFPTKMNHSFIQDIAVTDSAVFLLGNSGTIGIIDRKNH